MTIEVNGPKTAVTAGSRGLATATLPNVCKMPGPPAPFVPTPLPNIGRTSDNPKGYSTSVKFEGHAVAIRGASFGSVGDMASKATGGGITSANTHGPCKFLGPGSLNVRIEGKNIQLLSDPVTNNGGPSGSPANAATMLGIVQSCGSVKIVPELQCPVCGATTHTVEETPTTKVDASTLIQKYEEALTLPDARMVAVVVCKGNMKYAACSSNTPQEFADAAEKAGMKHPPASQTAAGGALSAANSGRNAKSKATARENMAHSDTIRGIIAGVEGETAATRLLDELENAEQLSFQRKGPMAFPVGNCAAQRAFLLMRQDGGVYAGMSEKWFSTDLKREKTGRNLKFAWINSEGTRLGIRLKQDVFGHGASVPPCKTCDTLMPYLTICAEKSCEHT